ncbi:MAG: hypothetical protein ACK2UQ_00565, partial [Anaerolineae bacterium]
YPGVRGEAAEAPMTSRYSHAAAPRTPVVQFMAKARASTASVCRKNACPLDRPESPRGTPRALAPTLRLEAGAIFELHELVTDRRDEKALGLGVGQQFPPKIILL